MMCARYAVVSATVSRHERRREQRDEPDPQRLGRGIGQGIDRGMTHAPEHAVDARQCVGAALLHHEGNRFRREQQHERNETEVGDAAKDEDGGPAMIGQQPRRGEAADDRADRISARHQHHSEIALRGIGRLGDRGVGRREHAADAETGDHPPDRQLDHVMRGRRAEHAKRHADQAAKDGKPTPDAIRHATKQQRARRHADQLHRQHEAERAPIDAPILGDARRGEADRQHIEAIERVEADHYGNDRPLKSRHRGAIDDRAWIGCHSSPPDFPG
jgi:hypothetical protein